MTDQSDSGLHAAGRREPHARAGGTAAGRRRQPSSRRGDPCRRPQPDQVLTAAPTRGLGWSSTPPPAGWATQGGLDFAAAPVQPVPAPARRRRGLRWLVAAAIVVLVAASASAAFFIMAGAASPSTVARWAPADSIVYVEARFDLPGDQHAKAGPVPGRVPGLRRPGQPRHQARRALRQGDQSASDGKADYSTDIKPWFGGQVGGCRVGAADVRLAHQRPAPCPSHGAFLLSVTDAAKASAWLDQGGRRQGRRPRPTAAWP